MAFFKAGNTDVPTATTRVQISNTSEKIKCLAVKAPSVNAGRVFFGGSAVSAANGYSLDPGDALELDFGEGSVAFSTFYVDAAVSGDDVNWGVYF